MKMVKSLLLGTATGIVAAAGVAQAADLPVKAAPVEYVRICSAYGAGYYYIPGTDTCLKVGGLVYVDWTVNAAGGHGPYFHGTPGINTRTDRAAYGNRTRAAISADARTQTEWGTLRSYISLGYDIDQGAASWRGNTMFNRGFIQFAGLTIGKTASFFDFYNNALNFSTLIGGGASSPGMNVFAYTAQFGGGFSATLSIEDAYARRAGIWDAGGNALAFGGIPGGGVTINGPGSYSAQVFPEIVGNLRVDQPWGSAQLSGVVRDVSGGYHSNNINNGSAGLNDVGFAVGGGLMFNLPWAQGDQFWIQGTYTRGATNYLGFNSYNHFGSSSLAVFRGGGLGSGSLGAVWALDAVYDSPGGLGGPGSRMSLVEGWSVLAAVQHFWQPNLRTSVFGHYTSVNFGATATDIFCNNGDFAAGGIGAGITSCNPSFNVWQVGSRTIWSPVRNLDIGVEVLYTNLDQRFAGNWTLPAAGLGARPGGAANPYAARDQNILSGGLRITRSFWP